MIPPYFSSRLAAKILFIGNGIQVLKQKQAIPTSELERFLDALCMFQKSDTLHMLSFEYTMDKIRHMVGKQLWQFIIVDAQWLQIVAVTTMFALLTLHVGIEGLLFAGKR